MTFFRQAGYAVLTQGVSSAANFLISVLMLRLLTLETFGYYFYLYLFASFGSAFTAAITGSVYPICRPRMGRLPRHYAAAYNGLNVVVVPVTVAVFSTAALIPVTPLGGVGLLHVLVFVGGLVLIDNIKLQGGAEGAHKAIFVHEVARQGALVALIAVAALTRHLELAVLVLLHGATGLVAALSLAATLRLHISFRRFRWVARRHFAHARHLVPANLVSTLHATAIQFLVAREFGPQAVGLLRAAELPFNALNPVKLSLALFLPGWIYRLEQRPVAAKRRLLKRAAAIVVSASVAAGLVIWGAAVLVLPVLTLKPYPVWLGLGYGLISAIMIVLVSINYYLTVLNGARYILSQAVLGAVVALAVWFGAAPFIAHFAAPASLFATFAAMTIYAAANLFRLAWQGRHSARITPAAGNAAVATGATPAKAG
ncbi:MAG: hypothetical protein R3D27_03075 [Hyphomicrobiaceae bacterium]